MPNQNVMTDDNYGKLRRERGYNYEDILEICHEALPNYDEEMKNFLHKDEEIRCRINFLLKQKNHFVCPTFVGSPCIYVYGEVWPN